MNIFILSGSGLSAESGIATFRGEDGTWNGVKVDEVATPDGFMEDPDRAYSFYRNVFNKVLSGEIKPNAAHEALARLKSTEGIAVSHVTQNVDNLATKAGMAGVIHMHGEIGKGRCVKSSEIVEVHEIPEKAPMCTCCETPQLLRPHVCFFHEIPFRLDEIYERLMDCDVFVAIGTSGLVYPAAGYLYDAARMGKKTIEINLEPTDQELFDVVYEGKATEQVPRFVDDMIKLAEAESSKSESI